MAPMYDILIDIVGVPANDYQALVLYMTACFVSLLVIFFILHLFRLTANMFRVGRR
ncbi:hypothetical protein HWN40_13230 [Methanolobus zinderi]|uniref:Uncharacterized protein n=1 Tax=Methanolobus zinderi TaxID=536044 RepID=A0A7D5E7T4_9EURY|nr:hypothetical protein [Methanolobus zinderi]QLC51112.1 hypothetical protein HWN40_13230 [Methanolobus zinderi]